MARYAGRLIVVAGTLVGALTMAVGVAAQTPSEQKPAPKIKVARAVPIQSVEGKDNYDVYCAVCHGTGAKGDGPAAPAMKVPVPDLTAIAARRGGKYNGVEVEEIIRGAARTPTPAHGIEDMPVWGDVFRVEAREKSTLRIRNLVVYLQSIQVGATTKGK